MSKADKMFEELGYKKEEDNFGIIEYYKRVEEPYLGNKNYKCFYAKYTIVFSSKTFYKYSNCNNKSFTMEELQAINEKVKELGWNE